MHRLIVPVVLALAFLFTGVAEAGVKKRAPAHEIARDGAKHWVLDSAGQWGLGSIRPR